MTEIRDGLSTTTCTHRILEQQNSSMSATTTTTTTTITTSKSMTNTILQEPNDSVSEATSSAYRQRDVFWMKLEAKLKDIEWLKGVQWMNQRGPPRTPYIPTKVSIVAICSFVRDMNMGSKYCG